MRSQAPPSDPRRYNTPMTRHVGIVGCSAEGAALCYRTFCAEAADALREAIGE